MKPRANRGGRSMSPECGRPRPQQCPQPVNPGKTRTADQYEACCGRGRPYSGVGAAIGYFLFGTSRQFKILLAVFLTLALAANLRAETDAAAKVLARVALLSDPHVNRATNGDASNFKAHFDKAIAQVNAAKVDFVLIAGDLTQSGLPEEFADFKNHIKALRAPVFFVPGNHDVGHKFNSGQINGTVAAERVEAYEKSLGPSWFTKKKAGVRIIGINSSLLGSGFARE